MLRLVVYHGHEEQVFAVSETEAKLGSAPENDFVVRAPGISRRHVAVRRVPGGVEMADLGSKNGLYIEGRRVERAVLSPGGLRIQAGTAWLEVEEVSSSQESLVYLLHRDSLGRAAGSSLTATVDSRGTLLDRSPGDVALGLARRIAESGAGIPGKRAELLFRIRETLGAEAFAVLERARRGQFHVREIAGEFSSEDTKLLASLVAGVRLLGKEQVALTRSDLFLLAGRDVWLLGAKFENESLAHEGWRKDLLRFLAHQFFLPIRSLDDLNSTEASRVLALAKGNKRKAASLLGISPGTLYKLLSRRGTRKRES